MSIIKEKSKRQNEQTKANRYDLYSIISVLCHSLELFRSTDKVADRPRMTQVYGQTVFVEIPWWLWSFSIMTSQLKLPDTLKIWIQAATYDPSWNLYNLCLWKKGFCRRNVATLNKRNELETFCRHAGIFLLKPGFHMIATISKKSVQRLQRSCGNTLVWPRSDRNVHDRWDEKFSMSAIKWNPSSTIIAIVGIERYPRELCNQSFELPSCKKSKNMIVGTTSSAKTKKTCLWNWISGPKSLKSLI